MIGLDAWPYAHQYTHLTLLKWLVNIANSILEGLSVRNISKLQLAHTTHAQHLFLTLSVIIYSSNTSHETISHRRAFMAIYCVIPEPTNTWHCTCLKHKLEWFLLTYLLHCQCPLSWLQFLKGYKIQDIVLWLSFIHMFCRDLDHLFCSWNRRLCVQLWYAVQLANILNSMSYCSSAPPNKAMEELWVLIRKGKVSI